MKRKNNSTKAKKHEMEAYYYEAIILCVWRYFKSFMEIESKKLVN